MNIKCIKLKNELLELKKITINLKNYALKYKKDKILMVKK